MALESRTFDFGVSVVRLARHLESQAPSPLAEKVITLGTELGANVAAAAASTSRRYSLKRYSAARRQSRELVYWFRLAAASAEPPDPATYKPFIDECRLLADLLTQQCQLIHEELQGKGGELPPLFQDE